MPTGAGKLLRGWGHSQVLEADAGDELELGGLVVRATPAVHESSRGPLSAATASLGYVVSGSTTVYFAGDTDLFDGMAEIGPVDVVVLPVSGWGSKLPAGHLDPRGAAQALRLLRPGVAIPVHWGTYRTPFAPRPDDAPAVEFARAGRRRSASACSRSGRRSIGRRVEAWVKRGSRRLAVAVIVGTYVFMHQFAAKARSGADADALMGVAGRLLAAVSTPFAPPGWRCPGWATMRRR